MSLSGVQSEFRLDSRLKHAGMTDLEKILESPCDKFICAGSVERFAGTRPVAGPRPLLISCLWNSYKIKSHAFVWLPLPGRGLVDVLSAQVGGHREFNKDLDFAMIFALRYGAEGDPS